MKQIKQKVMGPFRVTITERNRFDKAYRQFAKELGCTTRTQFVLACVELAAKKILEERIENFRENHRGKRLA